MMKKISTIAILVFSFNQKSYADFQKEIELNDENTQEVSWPGYVAQSFISQGLLCYELIKTETYKNNKPKPQHFINDSRFISCNESNKDITKSNNRYVTVTGKVLGTLENDDYEYPVVIADKIHKWKYAYFDDTNVGTIKPRLDGNRFDYVLNYNGL